MRKNIAVPTKIFIEKKLKSSFAKYFLKMWNCVEDRVESRDRMYSRVIRKLIFDEIYSDRNAVLGQKPIPAKIISNLKVKDKFLSS